MVLSNKAGLNGVLTSARARADSGVSSAGFTTTVQPAASAAPTFLLIMALGKFHWTQNKHRVRTQHLPH